PGGQLGKLALVDFTVEPFHNFLRDTFRETRSATEGPRDFIGRVYKQRESILWNPNHFSISKGDETICLGESSAVGSMVSDYPELKASSDDCVDKENSSGIAFSAFKKVAEKLFEIVRAQLEQWL
ncbi:MAG: hypothetical protein ACOC9J_04355, partial [Persicimonas sp.]